METGGRVVPPSHERIAAAAREGLFAGSQILTGGLVLIAGAAMFWLMKEWLAGTSVGLVREGLFDAVTLRLDPTTALCGCLARGVAFLSPLAGALFAVALAGAVIPALMARRGVGQTAVSIPKEKPARVSSFVLAAAGVAAFTLLSVKIIGGHGFPSTGAGSAPADLPFSLIAAAGVVMCLVGMIDLALRRARIWRNLHLTRSEAVREERASSGDRAARSRVRAKMGEGVS